MGITSVARAWSKRRRGFGHFMAIALGVAAMLGFFGIIFPVAKTMITSTATNMQQVNSQVMNTLCSATDLTACTTSTSCTGAGGTWNSTSNTCS